MTERLKLLIDSPGSACRNMSVDQVLLENTSSWLRFYQWELPTVSLGYFQSAKDICQEVLDDGNTDLVRRLTGGKAVLHQHELTYSISVPVSWFPGHLNESYEALGLCLQRGLKLLDIETQLVESTPQRQEGGNCFQMPGWFEVLYEGKKIVGSAQIRRKGRLLQHGSILICRDVDLINRVFPSSGDGELNSISIEEVLGRKVPMVELINAMKEGFSLLGRHIIPSILSLEEERRVKELIQRRYSTEDWNYRR